MLSVLFIIIIQILLLCSGNYNFSNKIIESIASFASITIFISFLSVFVFRNKRLFYENSLIIINISLLIFAVSSLNENFFVQINSKEIDLSLVLKTIFYNASIYSLYLIVPITVLETFFTIVCNKYELKYEFIKLESVRFISIIFISYLYFL